MSNNELRIIGNIYVSGVYCIETLEGKILYYGSAGDIGDAKNRHLFHLRNGNYTRTNKQILQDEFENGNLQFRVLDETTDEKEMGDLEQYYINVDHNCCNSHKSVTRHSSNSSKLTTWKRKNANRGERNPNASISEQTASEILWLKLNTKMRTKDIANMYGISDSNVSKIGTTRWLNIDSINKPEWLDIVPADKEEETATSANVQSL